MENKDLASNIFKGIASILMAVCLFILSSFGNSLDHMQFSVNKLNISLASMSEKLISHTFRYNLLDKKIRILEIKQDERLIDRWTKTDHNRFELKIKEELERLKLDIKQKNKIR